VYKYKVGYERTPQTPGGPEVEPKDFSCTTTYTIVNVTTIEVYQFPLSPV